MRLSFQMHLPTVPMGRFLYLIFGYTHLEKPNIVFILADDLGWMDTALYGSEYFDTPNINKMAERGMMFTNAYAANPLCSPTRSSIQTGMYPARTGFTSAAGHLPDEIMEARLAEDKLQPWHKSISIQTITRLDLKYKTIGRLFKEAGYATGYMGKWHMGRDPHNAPQHGFDTVVGAGHHPSPGKNGYFYPEANRPCPGGEDGQHIDDYVTEKSMEFIDDHTDDPFLLFLNLYDVHTPFMGKPELVRKYEEKQKGMTDPQSFPIYGAMVEEVDQCVGRIVDKLEEHGLTENTLLIFFSDNGGDMYDKYDGLYPTTNAPLRGGKANLFEGGFREPLIAVWPGNIPAGKTSDAFFCSTDLYATFLDTAGIEIPEDHSTDCVSQKEVLLGNKESVRDEIFCFFPHYGPRIGQLPGATLRKGDWKLIRYFHDNPDQTHRYELFNLADDIGETRNVAHEHPELVRELDERIEEIIKETGAVVPPKNDNYDPDAYEWNFQGWTSDGFLDNAEITKEGLLLDPASFGPNLVNRDIPECSGDLILSLTIRSDHDGAGQITWYEKGAAEGTLPRSAFFTYSKSDKLQTIECRFNSGKDIDIIRIEPSREPYPVTVGEIVLKTAEGEVLKEWSFS